MKLENLILILFVGAFTGLNAMEKPSAPAAQTASPFVQFDERIPSLQTKAFAQLAKKMKTVQEIKETGQKLPAGSGCEFVKALIQSKKFDYETLTDLLNTLCKNDPLYHALEAYYFYLEVKNGFYPAQVNIGRVGDFAKEAGNDFGYRVAHILDRATIYGTTPTALAIGEQDSLAYGFLRSMGIKPSTPDLSAAIKKHDNALAQQLLQLGVPADDPKLELESQPLYYALDQLNEPMIASLLKAGASFNTIYKRMLSIEKESIDKRFRDKIHFLLAHPEAYVFHAKTPEEFDATLRRQLEILDQQKAIEESRKTEEIWVMKQIRNWFK